MIHKKRGSQLVLFFGDILLLLAALFLTLFLRYGEWPEASIIEQHLSPFLLLIVVWVVVYFIVGLYDQYILFARDELPRKIVRTQIVNVLLAVLLFFVLPLGISPKTNLAIYLIVSLLLIVPWRLYIFPLLATGGSIRALVIGGGEEADAVTDFLNKNPYYRQVDVNHIDTRSYFDEVRISDALTNYFSNHTVDVVIADVNETLTNQLSSLFFNLTFLERQTTFISLTDFYERLFKRIPPSLIGESWLLQNIQSNGSRDNYDLFRRLLDIVGAMLLLIPCLVIFPIVMIALKVQDGGAIFYRTTRIGQNNQPINIYKFRTMNGCDSGEEALQSKLYVTSLGLFLRKLRIDELPQIINILRGDLSFIGPRPEIPELAAVYDAEIPYYNLRHLIKPGLSGWAQINDYDVPRQGVDIERTVAKLSFDLYYLRRRSLWLDIEIALKTINTVLSRTGT